jgi:hypothetical protein
MRLVWTLALVVASAAGRLQAAPAPQSPSTAAPSNEAPSSKAAEVDDEALLRLVGQLDADTLQARQQASDALLAAGSRAIGPLVAALPRATAETTMRGLAILKKLAQSADAETKRHARTALEQLASADQPSLAAQAAAILKTQDPLVRSTIRAPGQVVGIPGGFRMFQVQMINGPATRRVVARENGQTVVIAESRDKGITVTFSERVDGKDRTTTVAAETSEDLDRKSPQAAALYRKYMAGGGLGFPGGNPLVAPGMVIPPQPFRALEQPRPAPPRQKP